MYKLQGGAKGAARYRQALSPVLAAKRRANKVSQSQTSPEKGQTPGHRQSCLCCQSCVPECGHVGWNPQSSLGRGSVLRRCGNRNLSRGFGIAKPVCSRFPPRGQARACRYRAAPKGVYVAPSQGRRTGTSTGPHRPPLVMGLSGMKGGHRSKPVSTTIRGVTVPGPGIARIPPLASFMSVDSKQTRGWGTPARIVPRGHHTQALANEVGGGMARGTGALQRADILLVESNGRRDQPRHTLTNTCGAAEGQA